MAQNQEAVRLLLEEVAPKPRVEVIASFTAPWIAGVQRLHALTATDYLKLMDEGCQIALSKVSWFTGADLEQKLQEMLS